MVSYMLKRIFACAKIRSNPAATVWTALLCALISSGCGETNFATASDSSRTMADSKPERDSQDLTVEKYSTEVTPTDETDFATAVSEENEIDIAEAVPEEDLTDAVTTSEKVVIEDTSEFICLRDGPKNYSFSSGSIYSASSHGGPAAKNVVFSPVMTFDLENFSGNVLPIKNYMQDDVVMLVPSDVTEEQLITFQNGVKMVNVPPDAIFVRDANNKRFASGKVDDSATIIYKFNETKSFTLPGGTSKTLSEIYDLANIQTPSNNVRLSRLSMASFLDTKGRNISFRIALIPHGVGYLTYTLQVPGCL